MKKKSFHIAIDEPCSENWQNMQANADGKFCLHCSKTVTDFTKQTSYEIKSYFQQIDKGNTCGRFTKQQLQEIYTIYEANKFDHYKFVATLALGLLTLETLNAFSIDGKDFKNEKDSVQIVKLVENTKKIDSVTILKIGEKQETLITLKGTVRDSATNELLIGVNIFIENDKLKGTVTDFDGKYEIRVNKGDTVIIRYVGYIDENIIATKNETYNVQLSQDALGNLDQVIVTAGGARRIDGCSKKQARKYKRKHKH